MIALLKIVNRQCYNKDTIEAIQLLKDAGLKIMIHIMPMLPQSTPEIDKKTFDDLINKEEYQIDEIKIYPTSVTKTSERYSTRVNSVIQKMV